MKQVNLKKVIIPNLPYFLLGLYATKLGQAWRLAPGISLADKLLRIMDGLVLAVQSAAPSFHPIDLVVGIACGAGLRFAVYMKGKNAKKYRQGAEYGTARWGNAQDIAPYLSPKFEDDIILTQTERLTMNSRPKDAKTARNKNVLVIGGSGSGKTSFFLKPNLMQCRSKSYSVSFVVTDPKGSVVCECGKMLQRYKYRIKILNTINFKKSMHYNPFAYIHDEKREILNVFLVTDDDIIICDPEAEYYPVVHRLEGQVIKISPTSKQYVNPMDLNLDYSDDESPLSLNSDVSLYDPSSLSSSSSSSTM